MSTAGLIVQCTHSAMDRTRLPNGQRTGDVSAVVDAMHELGPSFIESTLQHALAGKHPSHRSIDRSHSLQCEYPFSTVPAWPGSRLEFGIGNWMACESSFCLPSPYHAICTSVVRTHTHTAAHGGRGDIVLCSVVHYCIRLVRRVFGLQCLT